MKHLLSLKTNMKRLPRTEVPAAAKSGAWLIESCTNLSCKRGDDGALHEFHEAQTHVDPPMRRSQECASFQDALELAVKAFFSRP